MSRWTKVLDQVRRTPRNVRFADLCGLVERVGYELDRTRGSHRHYRKPGYPGINLQAAKGGKAKHYQVRQVLAILDEYELEVD